MSRHRLTLFVLPDSLAVCRLDKNDPLPNWASSQSFVSVTRTADELSILCPQSLVPDGVRCERGWRCLRVAGTMDFSMIGVVASLITPLAGAGISVFVVSTFDTDYVLVKDNDLKMVLTVLCAAGHNVNELFEGETCPPRGNDHKEDAMKIHVTEHIHLSELQPSDEAACVHHFRDKEIYDRTLRIPFPYTPADF